jgi:hypothetical protein
MYTDPGSGLFFMQIVIAAALSAIYSLRRPLSALLRRRRKSNIDSGE